MITVIIAGIAAAGLAMFGISHESVEQKQINVGKAIFESHGEVLNDNTIRVTQIMILPMSSLKERDINHLSYEWGNLSAESNNSIIKSNVTMDSKYFDCNYDYDREKLSLNSKCVQRDIPMRNDEWIFSQIQKQVDVMIR